MQFRDSDRHRDYYTTAYRDDTIPLFFFRLAEAALSIFLQYFESMGLKVLDVVSIIHSLTTSRIINFSTDLSTLIDRRAPYLPVFS